jgi:23S rRNA pseudouridine955/2504/2580 synthase
VLKTAILYENGDFLAMAKPAGVETVSQTGGADFLALARETAGEPGLAVVHRLDRDTSGALLLARTPEAEKKLTALFLQRRMMKTYLALCLGRPRNAEGRINRRLSEWAGGHRPVKTLKQGGLEASTDYRVAAVSEWLAEDFRVSMIAFRPHQGRTHQIRVHAAAFGYPVLGDDQYGDRKANAFVRQGLGIRRQALHSARLRFEWNGAEADVFCPLADDMFSAARTLWPGRTWDGER